MRIFIKSLLRISAVFTLSITLLITGCGNGNSLPGPQSDISRAMTYTTYTSSKGFSLEYPSTWTLKDTGLSKSDVQIFAPEMNSFSSNITIKAGGIDPKNPDWSSLDNLKKTLTEGYKKQIKDFNLISTDITKIANTPTLKIEFTSGDPTPQSSLKAHSIQYWTIINNAYLLTEIVRPIDNTKLYEEEFNHILQSIKI